MKNVRQVLAVSVIIAACCFSSIVGNVASAVEPAGTSASDGRIATQKMSEAFRDAVAIASPGVVTVYVLRGPRMTAQWRANIEVKQRRKKYGASNVSPNSSLLHMPDGQGSGCIIDSQGFVLTCSHVLEGADAVVVETADGRTFTSTEYTLFREGQTIVAKVELGQWPRTVHPGAKDHAPPPDGIFTHFDDQLGIGVKELDTSIIQELELPTAIKGVLVTHVAMRSVAYMEGLAAGMAVLRINDGAIRNLKDYKQAMSKAQPEKPLFVLVHSDTGACLVTFKNLAGNE